LIKPINQVARTQPSLPRIRPRFNCGGSDAYSGSRANPALGAAGRNSSSETAASRHILSETPGSTELAGNTPHPAFLPPPESRRSAHRGSPLVGGVHGPATKGTHRQQPQPGNKTPAASTDHPREVLSGAISKGAPPISLASAAKTNPFTPPASSPWTHRLRPVSATRSGRHAVQRQCFTNGPRLSLRLKPHTPENRLQHRLQTVCRDRTQRRHLHRRCEEERRTSR